MKILGKSSAEMDYKKDFALPKVTQDFLDYLQTQYVVLELWGTQGNQPLTCTTNQINAYFHLNKTRK